MAYVEWLKTYVAGFLQSEWGAKLIAAVAAELDELTDELTQARRAAIPGAVVGSEAAADALEALGSERQLERGPTETDEEYSERLRFAWETWTLAGGHMTLLQQLSIAGFDRANLYVMQKSGRRSSINAGLDVMTLVDGPVWLGDAKPAIAYAAFGLLFVAPQADLTWTPAAGFSEEAAKLHRIARRWRPAKAAFWGTQVLGTGAWYGWPTTRTWGSFNWGGTSTFLPPQ